MADFLKPRIKKKQRFSINFDYNRHVAKVTKDAARRVGPFLETIQEVGKKQIKTFIVDFQLSGGYFYGWTLWDISGNGAEAVEVLQWIMSKDFPEEVKQTIMAHLKKRGLLNNARRY